MTATVAEPAAAPAPVVAEVVAPVPLEVLVVPLPGEVEERIHQLVRQCQAPIHDVVASWLAAAPEGAPVPAESSGAVRAVVPAHVAASVRAEAQRRGLQPGQVAAARLASVASRGS